VSHVRPQAFWEGEEWSVLQALKFSWVELARKICKLVETVKRRLAAALQICALRDCVGNRWAHRGGGKGGGE
jgi:hypothetical protein